jgi:hypothetical protein
MFLSGLMPRAERLYNNLLNNEPSTSCVYIQEHNSANKVI